MNNAKRSNFTDDLIRLINSYNPEYLDLAGDASKAMYVLIDSIDAFEEECNQPDPKEEAMREIELENMKAQSL
jgi:hypothetical protein